jgi:hypothetical protein
MTNRHQKSRTELGALMLGEAIGTAARFAVDWYFAKYIFFPIIIGLVLVAALIFGPNVGAFALLAIIVVCVLWIVIAAGNSFRHAFEPTPQDMIDKYLDSNFPGQRDRFHRWVTHSFGEDGAVKENVEYEAYAKLVEDWRADPESFKESVAELIEEAKEFYGEKVEKIEKRGIPILNAWRINGVVTVHTGREHGLSVGDQFFSQEFNEWESYHDVAEVRGPNCFTYNSTEPDWKWPGGSTYYRDIQKCKKRVETWAERMQHEAEEKKCTITAGPYTFSPTEVRQRAEDLSKSLSTFQSTLHHATAYIAGDRSEAHLPQREEDLKKSLSTSPFLGPQFIT